MKADHAILVFLLLFLMAAIRLDRKEEALYAVSGKKQHYDAALETAVNDAVSVLVVKDGGERPFLRKEEAVEVFFHSLFAGFGVMHDKGAQQELERSVPLILITDFDGFYFYYLEEYEEKGRNVRHVWSDKIPYGCYLTPELDRLYERGGSGVSQACYLGFTLRDTVYLLKEEGSRVYYRTRMDLRNEFPDIAVFQSEEYEDFRREAIINRIMGKMKSYIRESNRIGRQYGFRYEFSIPYLNDSDWARTMEDISMVVLFQGYPYGNQITETYNQVEIAGARAKKNTYYYLAMQEGKYTYHLETCIRMESGGFPCDSKRECALMGAYPCPDCRP